MQPILKLNSTSFMNNNIFCKMNIKKVIHWGVGGGVSGNGGNCPILFLEVQLQYLLEYPSILLGYPSNIHTFLPSIGSSCVNINFYIIHTI